MAITFDDGYLDSLETAAPILDEFDVPATFFVNAEGLDAPKEFWWDALARIILTVAGLPKRIELRVGGERRAFRLLDDADRHAAHGELYALLRPSLPAVRDDVVRQLSELAGPGTQARPGSRPMDRSEICRLAASPRFEIGAHGFHHLPLPALSAEHRHREVFGCRSALETVVGSAVTLFAYPYGDVSPESIETVQAADFRFAVTCRPRCVHRFEHALELPRCEVPGGSVEVFGAWLEGLLG